MSGFIGKLKLTIHNVQRLYDVQLVGKQDPYCTVTLQKKGKKAEKKKTRVARDGHKAPVWDQTFTFSLDGTETDIMCEVVNCNTIRDEIIGSCTVPVKSVCQSKQVFVYRLARGGANTFAGDLHVSGEFVGRGPAKAAPAQPVRQGSAGSVVGMPPPMPGYPGVMPGYPPPQQVAYDAYGRPVVVAAPQPPPVVFVGAHQPPYQPAYGYGAQPVYQPPPGAYPPQQQPPPQQQGQQRPQHYNQQSYH